MFFYHNISRLNKTNKIVCVEHSQNFIGVAGGGLNKNTLPLFYEKSQVMFTSVGVHLYEIII